MGGFIGEEQLRRVREAVDLVDVLGDYTTLQRAGGQFRGLCPFHQERTPSFYAYPDDQHYHCYGCGAHGDVITLIREKENLEFVDAVELLARRAGIQLEYEDRGKQHLRRGRRQSLSEVMERATAFYERMLWEHESGAEARAYLAERGLDPAVCREFRLGWAPGRGRLVAAARRAGIAIADLGELDLAVERQGRWADRFFERLIFPICDRFGHPVAFSGRLLPAAQRAAKEAGRSVGKYINSTETPLFKKGEVVFNLHRARRICRQAGRLIVMEGPTDVMAAAQAQTGECVAVLGTALTERHARQMGTIAGDGRIFLLFDGDAAGRTTSIKTAGLMLGCGVPCRVALLPSGADPAELLGGGGEEGRRAFAEVLQQARPEMQFLLEELAPRPHELDPRGQLAIVDRLLAHLRGIEDRDLRLGYLQEVADYLGLDAARLQARLEEGGRRSSGRERDRGRNDTAEPPLPPPVADALRCLIRHPELRAEAFDELGCEPALFPLPWRTLIEYIVCQPDADPGSLSLCEPAVREPLLALAVHRLSAVEEVGDPRAVLVEAVTTLRTEAERQGTRRLRHVLRQSRDDSEESERLFREALERNRQRNARVDGLE